MIRKKKKYSRPKKAFEISRIKEENALLKKYALKNKLEVWKTMAKIDYFRRRAKALAKSPIEKQQVLFNKLKALGLNTNTIADVLALKIENLLERRLPTIVFKKNLAKTIKEARQMVVHKRVLIDNKVINIPSYLVSVAEEGLITLKKKAKKVEQNPKPEQVSSEPAKEALS
ncbi:MAG: 30S ribosomal protein S4 [Candidatus Pacearchaeota archaeon]